jgi:glycosyltransferase involved in cell wall biosynthesis
MPARGQGRIVFIGDFLFPEGDAAAIRTLSLARICRDLGYAVTVIGKGQLRSQDYHEETGRHHIEGIHYSTMNPKPVSARQRLRHPIQRLRQSVSALEALDLEDARAVIINASGSARHVPFVSAFCRRRSIPLVCDVCEWYDPRQMNYGRLDPAYAAFWLVFHWALPRLRHLIVISRLLERHFEERGCDVIRIPPVLDPSQIPCADVTPRDHLVLLYAGLPGRKDLLTEFLVALASLQPDQRTGIVFRLLGPTRHDLVSLLGRSAGLLDVLGETVKPLGRVSRERVLAELQGAHFTVLLRPDKRYANAGFPSKVPESLAAGAPILLNLTSDLEEYLGDGTAALRVRDCSQAEVTKALRRALELTEGELRELRHCARAKAEQYFDYRLYLDAFASFLAQLD